MPRSEKEVLADNVREWVEKAEEDFQAAQQLIKSGSLWNVIGFHCQQAAEKYLKSLLTAGKIEFSKTHNLIELVGLLAKMKPGLSRKFKEVHSLTPYAIFTRYPGDAHPLKLEEAKEALRLASKTRRITTQFVKKFNDSK